ncbi:hypothetical protein COOONC_18014 [Cooperia oncophora]
MRSRDKSNSTSKTDDREELRELAQTDFVKDSNAVEGGKPRISSNENVYAKAVRPVLRRSSSKKGSREPKEDSKKKKPTGSTEKAARSKKSKGKGSCEKAGSKERKRNSKKGGAKSLSKLNKTKVNDIYNQLYKTPAGRPYKDSNEAVQVKGNAPKVQKTTNDKK